jgi:WD40 repeat protein
MSEILTSGLIRVLRADGGVAGTGFLISPEMAVTCTHVLAPVGSPVPKETSVRFYDDDAEYTAVIDARYCRPADAEDITFLTFDRPVTDRLPLPLGSSNGTNGHEFDTFGFPSVNAIGGIRGDGHVLGKIHINKIPVLQIDSKEVTPGFSGAPVLDKLTGRVIGLVTRIAAPDEYGRLRDVAFIIPSESLRAVLPTLSIEDACPYRGLSSFTSDPEDIKVFRGRERLTCDLLAQLRKKPNFLAVVGQSGSGKSSVVNAGLLPAIRSAQAGFTAGRVSVFPLSKVSLDDVLSAAKEVDASTVNGPGAPRTVFVLDELEQFFVVSSKAQETVIPLLAKLVNNRPGFTLVTAFRSDFYDPVFTSALGPSLDNGQVNVRLMNVEELKSAIGGPAASMGLRFSEGLVDDIAADATQLDNPLPLLEFALTQLWEERNDGELTREAYRRMKGVAGSIASWATDAFLGLSEEERKTAQKILLRLIHYGDGNTPDTRKRVALADLLYGSHDQAQVLSVVMKLATSRLVITDRDLSTKRQTVNLVHDALITQWQQLAGWIKGRRHFLEWRQRFGTRMEEWEDSGRDDSGLLRGYALNDALVWLGADRESLSVAETRYINKSAAARELEEAAEKERQQRDLAREKRLREAEADRAEEAEKRAEELSEGLAAQKKLSAALKWSFLTISLLFLAATVTAVYATWQRHISEARRVDALGSKLAAVSRSLMDRSHFQLETAALLTAEGLRRRPSPELFNTAQQLLTSVLKPISLFPSIHTWMAVAVTSDGNLVATAESVKESGVAVVIRKMPEGKERARTNLPKQDFGIKLKFDPTATHLVIVGDKDAWLWDWNTPNPMVLPKLGQREIIVSRSGRWVAGLNEDGLQIYDLKGEYPHRVLPEGKAPWMHSIAFGANDTLVLAKDDEPGFVYLIRLPDCEVLKRFFATRRESQIDPNAPVMDVFGYGKAKAIEQGIKPSPLLVTTDGCTLMAVESRFIIHPGDQWAVHLWNICGEPHRIKTIVHASQTKWAISSDGSVLAGGDEDGRVSVYRLPQGESAASRVLGTSVAAIAVSADGSRVITTHRGDTAIVWDWQSDEILGRAPAPTEFEDVVEGGSRLFGLTYQQNLQAWLIPPKIGDGRLVFSGALSGVVIAPSSDAAVAWSDGRETVEWRPSSGALIRKYGARIGSAQISDSGDRLMLVTTHVYILEEEGRKLDIELPQEFEEIVEQNGSRKLWIKADTSELTFPDRVTVEAVPRSGIPGKDSSEEAVSRTVFWSKSQPEGWNAQKSMQSRRGGLGSSAVMRGDGKEAAVSIGDWVFRYDVETGKRTGKIALGYVLPPPEPTMFGRGDESEDPKVLTYDASGVLWIETREGSLRRWDNAGLKLIKDRHIVARDGTAIVFRAKNESDYVVNGDGTTETPLHLQGSIRAVSPDGRLVASTVGVEKPTVEVIGGHNPGVFDLSVISTGTGKALWTSRHIGAEAAAVVFSPDGSLVALGDQEGTVRVWRVADGVEVSRLSTRGSVGHLLFTHDSSRILLSGSETPKTIFVAPLPIKILIQNVCSLVTRTLTPDEWEEYFKGEKPRSTCDVPGS